MGRIAVSIDFRRDPGALFLSRIVVAVYCDAWTFNIQDGFNLGIAINGAAGVNS